MNIVFKKLHPLAVIPAYATPGAAGMDLVAVEEMTLHPTTVALVKTGLAVQLPPGYELQIRPRSGLALKHGVTVLNSPGTIDSDYRGEIGVILINHDRIGAPPFLIKPGDRIAQAVIAKVERLNVVERGELDVTFRGAGGFGSTGIGR